MAGLDLRLKRLEQVANESRFRQVSLWNRDGDIYIEIVQWPDDRLPRVMTYPEVIEAEGICRVIASVSSELLEAD